MGLRKKYDHKGRIIGGEIDAADSMDLIRDHARGQCKKVGNVKEKLGAIFVHLENGKKGRGRWMVYTTDYRTIKSSTGMPVPNGSKVHTVENITALQHNPSDKWCFWIPPFGPWVWIGPC